MFGQSLARSIAPCTPPAGFDAMADRSGQPATQLRWLIVALLLLALWVTLPFLHALAWAGVIAIATWPLRERMADGVGLGAASLLLTMVVALAILVPILGLGVQIAREMGVVTDFIRSLRDNGLPVPDWLGHIPGIGPSASEWWQEHLSDPEAAKALIGRSVPLGMLSRHRELGSSLLARVVTFAFTLLTLFFLYRDGPKLAQQAERIADRLFGPPAVRFGHASVVAVRATVNGLVLVGLAEGLVIGVSYVISGVSHPILLGLATAVLAIVPFGAPTILVLAALILYAQSQMLAALLVLAFGFFVVFVADHFVRPLLIGSAIRLPFLWTLIGVFGGLETFGLVGLFLGPAIMSIAVTIWREAAQPRAG